MASNKQKQKRINKRKVTTRGKERKRIVRAHGTTPKFPIHPEKPGKMVDVASLKLVANEN